MCIRDREIIGVEHDHKRKWYGGMAYVSPPVDVSVPTSDEKERETEHNPPAEDVYKRQVLVHSDRGNMFHERTYQDIQTLSAGHKQVCMSWYVLLHLFGTCLLYTSRCV